MLQKFVWIQILVHSIKYFENLEKALSGGQLLKKIGLFSLTEISYMANNQAKQCMYFLQQSHVPFWDSNKCVLSFPFIFH